MSQKQITHVDRVFEPSDLDGADMVLVAIDDPAASTTIWKLCKEKKVPANIADVPPECDFYFGSVHRDGPLQIMVSTNGKGPRLAASLRRFIAAQLPKNCGNAIEAIGELRTKLRKVAPTPEDGPKRMRWSVSRLALRGSANTVQDVQGQRFVQVGGHVQSHRGRHGKPLALLPGQQGAGHRRLVCAVGGTDVKKLDVFDGSFGFSIGI